MIFKTCRVQIIGLEEYKENLKQGNHILIQWHNRIVLTPYFLAKYTPKIDYSAFVSESRDGDWLASAIEYFPNGFTVRVPKDNKHVSVKSLIKILQISNMVGAITPDGPRGPKYGIKPGVILIARAAKANLTVFTWSASRTWSLPTWDDMLIPKPFSRIIFGLGSSFTLYDLKKTPIKEMQHLVKTNLTDFVDQIDNLAKKKN